ncbi:MAG: hypothetical protein WBZ20_10805 [Nitrososphaeraceae archaeon]
MENLSMISSHILSSVMLVRVNGIDSMKSRVKVTQLDIDDFGSVIPLKELELNVSTDDDSIIQTLKNSSYAAIFTEDSIEENKSVIILANGMTIDELNREKSKTINKALANSRQI